MKKTGNNVNIKLLGPFGLTSQLLVT